MKLLREFGTTLKNEIHNAKFPEPKRSKVRADMKRAQHWFKQVERALDLMHRHWSQMTFAEYDRLYWDLMPTAGNVIYDLDKLCERISSRTPGKGGAPKKAGMVTCAMIVTELWSAVRGSGPGQDNEDAQQACADLWRVCGGAKSGNVGNGKWRRHLIATHTTDTHFRRYVRSRLREGTE
jgi:hypothetical protein